MTVFDSELYSTCVCVRLRPFMCATVFFIDVYKYTQQKITCVHLRVYWPVCKEK